MSPLSDISIVVERIACWSEWIHVWRCMCQLDWDGGDDLSIGFALIFAKQNWLKCLTFENVTTGDMFYWNVTTCDISFVVERIACWSEWDSCVDELCQLDWDGGMIWVSVSHWLLQSRKAEMPSVWKCHDWRHFYWNVPICDISIVDWMNRLLKRMNACVNGCVSWTEMEGWSEYRFCIDYCKAEKAEMQSVW